MITNNRLKRAGFECNDNALKIQDHTYSDNTQILFFRIRSCRKVGTLSKTPSVHHESLIIVLQLQMTKTSVFVHISYLQYVFELQSNYSHTMFSIINLTS